MASSRASNYKSSDRHRRKRCGHCNQVLSYSAYRSHKNLYYIEHEQVWITDSSPNDQNAANCVDSELLTNQAASESKSSIYVCMYECMYVCMYVFVCIMYKYVCIYCHVCFLCDEDGSSIGHLLDKITTMDDCGADAESPNFDDEVNGGSNANSDSDHDAKWDDHSSSGDSDEGTPRLTKFTGTGVIIGL